LEHLLYLEILYGIKYIWSCVVYIVWRTGCCYMINLISPQSTLTCWKHNGLIHSEYTDLNLHSFQISCWYTVCKLETYCNVSLPDPVWTGVGS
jgi:hypothetical protein